MIDLTTDDFFYMKVKKYVVYVKEGFVMIKIRNNLKYTKKLEIIVITQEDLEKLLIRFVT